MAGEDTVPTPIENQPPLPDGSAYMFNADAQAILEESPNLNLGLELLNQSYQAKQWDKPDEAASVASDYAQKLRYRFEDQTPLSEDEILNIAPVSLGSILGEGGTQSAKIVDQINQWESANLSTIDIMKDGDSLMIKDKLKEGVKNYASSLRRDSEGKDASWLQDKSYRAAAGLTGGISKLIGADNFVQNLIEHTNPDADSDFSSTLASGAGIVGGIAATAAITGGIGTPAYLLATGAGEVKSTYQDSMKATGDSGKATTAAVIEAVSQGAQLYVGQKIIGSAAQSVAKRLFGQEIASASSSLLGGATKEGLTLGTVQAGSGALSTEARNIGQNQNTPLLGEDTARNFAAGLIFGSAAHGIETLARGGRKPPEPLTSGTNAETGITAPIESDTIGGNVNERATEILRQNTGIEDPAKAGEAFSDFTTADGSTYSVTPEGTTIRTNAKTNEQMHPMDRTFYTDTDTATKAALLRSTKFPDGKAKIYTDGDTLRIKSKYINDDLTPSSELTGKTSVEIPASDTYTPGTHPIEANIPKNINGNKIQYQSHIGHKITEIRPQVSDISSSEGGAPTIPKSGGAAFIGEFNKESKLGQRIRLSPGLDEFIREGAGTKDTGFFRYSPQSRASTSDEAGQFLVQNGIEASTKHFLEMSFPQAHEVALGVKLLEHYQAAVANAREAGDLDSARKLAYLSDEINRNIADIGPVAGRIVDSFKLFKQFDPESKVLALEQKGIDAATQDMVAETGLSEKEIQNTKRNLNATEEQINKVESQAKTRQTKDKTIKEGETPKAPESYLTESEKIDLNQLKTEQKKLGDIQNKFQKKVSERLSNLDGEKIKKLRKIAKSSEGLTSDKALDEALKLEAKFEAKLPKGKGKSGNSNLLFTYHRANLLGDISTPLTVGWGNISQLLSTVAGYAATGKGAGTFLGSVINAARGIGKEAFIAELRGEKGYSPQTSRFTEEGKNNSHRRTDFRKQLLEKASTTSNPIAKLYLQHVAANVGWFLRGISAVDALSWRAQKEGQAAMIAMQEGARQGFKGKDLKNYISQQLFNSKENFDLAHKQATLESKTLSDEGIKQTPNDVNLRAWEILEQKRDPRLEYHATRFANKQAFTKPPDGFIGNIISGIQKVANAPIELGGQEYRPVRYVMEFLNAAGNLINSHLDFTPVGLVRAFSDTRELDSKINAIEKLGKNRPLAADEQATLDAYNTEKNYYKLDRRDHLGRFLVGTTVAGTLTGLAFSAANQKNPYFDIYGAGPSNPQDKRQWQTEGGRPWSIKWGNQYLRYYETPLGLMIGAIGTARDLQRSNSWGRQSALATVATMIGGFGEQFTEHSFLRNAADLLDAIRNQNGADAINALLIRPAQGFIPATSSFRMISKMFENPIDTYNNYWAKFISGTPIVDKLGTKPALNSMGEPVQREFQDRLSFIGKFWSQRVTDPGWRWLSDNGYHIPEPGPTVKLPKGEYSDSYEDRASKLGSAFSDVLTQDERYHMQEKIGKEHIIRGVIEEFRNDYGNSGYQEEVQNLLTKRIEQERSNVRRELFLP